MTEARTDLSVDSAIVVRGLTKRFGRFTAVDGVTFDVRRGEIFGFLGPNGAGKSTTIRMLCGLLASSTGAATVDGYDINRDSEKIRQRVGYMCQRFSLYRELTAAENLRFFGGVYGLGGGRRLSARVDEVLCQVGLEPMRGHLAGTLSGAFQQKLAFGVAIIHKPSILLLDEPTSGVDPLARRLFWDAIHAMAERGVTVLVTTHFLDEAEFCGRVAFINAGRLVAVNMPAVFRREAVDEDLFEVESPALIGVRDRIGGMDGVYACTYYGSRLHVFCRRGAHDAGSLAHALRSGNVDVRSVMPVAPSMEDAFVRLAQRSGAEHGGLEA
jgi:ABC-2 type transport system ATP-binding protein